MSNVSESEVGYVQYFPRVRERVGRVAYKSKHKLEPRKCTDWPVVRALPTTSLGRLSNRDIYIVICRASQEQHCPFIFAPFMWRPGEDAGTHAEPV